ncbi:endonuclease VII domain-containing protein [uncultured Marinobacter sp.]|uniref:endonuclease VII domain-containing protein n=1 Tax=uncultured Marinobacter sp. TaxID=187379 RepID=UPI0030D88BCC
MASAARNRSLDGRLRSQYGINAEQHRKFLEAQNGSCAICLASFEGRRTCVDHCHKSGRVRGLLCAKCNSAIGFLSDSTDALRRAIEYLDR